MTKITPTRIAATLAAAVSMSLAACGSSSGNQLPSTTATIGAAGGTLQAGLTVVSIPANALSTPTAVTVREAEPQHAGRVQRVEIEPHGLALAQPARVSIQVDDTNAHVRMHDDADDLVDVEVEDRNHGMYKTSVTQLGAVEVEVEHGTACAAACGSGQECDDGVCKAHVEDAAARTCSPVCGSGQECDDGVCKAHLEVEVEHGMTSSAAGVTCTPACATGLECDNGICKAHGGTHG